LRIAQDSGPYVIEDFADIPSTVEELENLLAREKAKLELSDDTDPALIEMFKKRREEIRTKESRHGNLEKELDSMRSSIEPIKNNWENGITSLVDHISDKFSDYFEKINCAGRVEINKTSKGPDVSPDEYKNWGIELMVKFRDSEILAPLTAHRQSGGERSVSIVLYLMAIQSFSKSPFRVIDEINQGMDPRNERLIHKQIIESVCEEGVSIAEGFNGGGQYFLITPKLLPDLIYHENMKVLTVYNGDYLPPNHQWRSNASDRWTR
jgi:chromosome segregation ATPase